MIKPLSTSTKRDASYEFVETPILVEPYIEEGDKVIDWEQRRYEIAMHILPQTLGLGNPEMLAINAVNHAEALIKELKKGGKNE